MLLSFGQCDDFQVLLQHHCDTVTKLNVPNW